MSNATDLTRVAEVAAMERGRSIKLGPLSELACSRLYPSIVAKETQVINEIWELMTPEEQAELQEILDTKHDAAHETCTSMIAQLTYELNKIDTEITNLRQRGGPAYQALLNRRDSALGDYEQARSLLKKLQAAL